MNETITIKMLFNRVLVTLLCCVLMAIDWIVFTDMFMNVLRSNGIVSILTVFLFILGMDLLPIFITSGEITKIIKGAISKEINEREYQGSIILISATVGVFIFLLIIFFLISIRHPQRFSEDREFQARFAGIIPLLTTMIAVFLQVSTAGKSCLYHTIKEYHDKIEECEAQKEKLNEQKYCLEAAKKKIDEVDERNKNFITGQIVNFKFKDDCVNENDKIKMQANDAVDNDTMGRFDECVCKGRESFQRNHMQNTKEYRMWLASMLTVRINILTESKIP